MPQYVTREHYFDAAGQILSTEGFRSLTMTALHRRLGVTSGSFYNYFTNWNDFVTQFLDYWTAATERIVAEASEARDPVERLNLLRALARTVPHDAESAIRMWSRTDDAVAKVQDDVDRRRLALIRTAVVEATGETGDADRYASMALTMIVGLQQRRNPVDLDELDWMLATFIRLVTSAGTGTR